MYFVTKNGVFLRFLLGSLRLLCVGGLNPVLFVLCLLGL